MYFNKIFWLRFSILTSICFCVTFVSWGGTDKLPMAKEKIVAKVKEEVVKQLNLLENSQINSDSLVEFDDHSDDVKSSHRKLGLLLAMRNRLRKRKDTFKIEKQKNESQKRKKVMLPSWPFCATLYEQQDIFSVDISGKLATQAYSSSGATQDISRLVFGEKNITIQDVFLSSKLIINGYLTSKVAYLDSVPATKSEQYHYLYLLADQKLSFDASTNIQQISLNYAHHVIRNDISFGLQVPIVRRKNEIRLSSTISPSLKEQLQSVTPKFYNLYDDLDSFFVYALNKKHIGFNKRDSEVGLGDITVFLNGEIRSSYCERCVIGGKIVVPSAKRRDVQKLWDPEFGNGGFTEIGLFGSLLFYKKRYFSPHVFANITYRIPSTVWRRVPEKKNNDTLTSGKKADENLTPFASEFVYEGSTFEVIDTTIRRFADSDTRTKIHKGSEINIILGNLFWLKSWRNSALDIFYDLRLKGKDYLGFRKNGEIYDASILTDNTFEVAHRAGVKWNYEWDDSWRMQTGLIYTFAGRNILRAYEINMAINFAF